MKQRSTSAGGECHTSQRRKGHRRKCSGLGYRRELVRQFASRLCILPGNRVSPFGVFLNFPTRSSPLFWRPSFFPYCLRGWSAAECPAFAETSPPRKGARRDGSGWGVHRHKVSPLEHSSKLLKSQLLECEATTTSSLGTKWVCHYYRPPARLPAPLRPCAGERNPSALRGRCPLSLARH